MTTLSCVERVISDDDDVTVTFGVTDVDDGWWIHSPIDHSFRPIHLVGLLIMTH